MHTNHGQCEPEFATYILVGLFDNLSSGEDLWKKPCTLTSPCRDGEENNAFWIGETKDCNWLYMMSRKPHH